MSPWHTKLLPYIPARLQACTEAKRSPIVCLWHILVTTSNVQHHSQLSAVKNPLQKIPCSESDPDHLHNHTRVYSELCNETEIKKSVCVLHLHSLDLRGLDDRWLRGLDDSMDLDRLSIGKLHQRHCGTCCWDVACCHSYLKIIAGVNFLHKCISSIGCHHDQNRVYGVWSDPEMVFINQSLYNNFWVMVIKTWTSSVTWAKVAICAGVICWCSVSVTAISAAWTSAADSIFIGRAEEEKQE